MNSKLVPFAALLAAALASPTALAQKKYDPGASDTEIKIGNTNPYSGLRICVSFGICCPCLNVDLNEKL